MNHVIHTDSVLCNHVEALPDLKAVCALVFG